MRSRRRLGLGDPAAERGAVAILTVFFVVLAMILVAFVIDRGRVFVARSQLQNAADAGALAAAALTCLDPLTPAADVRQEAIDYATANGAPEAGVSVAIRDWSPSEQWPRTGVSVTTRDNLDFFFDAFVTTSTAGVAAMATAATPCFEDFQIVVSSDTNYNGTGSTAGNIFAGQCFEGNGGTYNLVAVSSSELSEDEETICGNFHSGEYHIYNGQQQENGTPCPEGIAECRHNVTNVSPLGAFISTVGGQAAYDALVTSLNNATTACGDVTDLATDDVIACTGGNLNLSGDIAASRILVNGTISDNSANFIGDEVIIWATGDVTLNLGGAAGGTLPRNVVIYSEGTVTFTGSNKQVLGRVFATNLVLNGGSTDAVSSSTIRAPGTPQLVQ